MIERSRVDLRWSRHGGALADLDAAQVGNVKAAVANARAVAGGVVGILKAA
jgi:hypothetical protein